MKTTPTPPPVAKQQDTATTPVSPPWKLPPEVPPVEAPRTPVTKLPSLETFVGLAASMATPNEKPAATARRAMELFAACERELAEMERLAARANAEAKFLSDEFELVSAFLSNFKAGENIYYDSFDPGEKVTIDAFLEACMPRSRKEARMAKWRAFIAWKLSLNGGMIGLPILSESESADLAPILVMRFRESGFSIDERLSGLRDDFTAFLEDDRKAKASERGKKGGKQKKPLGVAT